MLKVMVRRHGQTHQTLELSDPATIYWAGRNDQCQIPLTGENAISRQHFKIFFKEGLWHLELTSRFGEIQIGENSIRELTLQEGVSFTLFSYEFQIESQHSMELTEDLALASGGDVKKNSSLSSGVGEEDKTVTRYLERRAQYSLFYKNSDLKLEKAFLLTKEELTVGRDSNCEIFLEDARVSRKQFKLKKKDGQYFLIDGQGINGTYLNKNKITSKDPILLKSGDRITILNHKFNFEIRDKEFENKISEVQKLALVDPVNSLAFDPNLFALNSSGNTDGQIAPGFANGALSQPQVKILNFWGLKIPLNKTNKIRLGIGIVLLIVLIIAGTDDSGVSDSSDFVAARPADPFSKLSPEEQKQVKVQYELAKDLYTQGNYQLAKDELAKVHAKIPSYLDSQELERFIEVGIQSAQEREQQERLKKEANELEERIQNSVAFCRQQIKLNTTLEQLDQCLGDTIQLNPEHELLVKIREDVKRIEEERKFRDAESKLRAAQIEELKKQFTLASQVGVKDPLKGIQALNDFLQLTMPDPDNLRAKAQKQIKHLENLIKLRVSSAISKIRKLVEEGHHKDAIISLEKALEVAPDNDMIQEEIDRVTEELRKKMQILYQEAILEENIGNIETAKERWKKIIQIDIPNGEYFAKAKVKMKKYGGS